MAKQRYERLKELTFEKQEDCPVVLDKGALLLDNVRGQCILQLKLLNGSTKPIEAVQVIIDCLDEDGKTIHTMKHLYRTKSEAGAYFGSDQAVDMNSDDVKDVAVSVDWVKFLGTKGWKAGTLAMIMRSAFLKAFIPFTVISLFLAILLSGKGGNAVSLSAFIAAIVFHLGIGIMLAVYIAQRRGTATHICTKSPVALILLCIAIAGYMILGYHYQMLGYPQGLSSRVFILNNLLSYALTPLLMSLAVIAMLRKNRAVEKNARLSIALMILLLVRAVLYIISAIASFGNGSWLAGIGNLLRGSAFIVFALLPEKSTQWLGKVFRNNNIPAQIGLAALAAFIINF